MNLFGRKPFSKAFFSEFDTCDVKPTGWLLDQLKIQAAGLTGKLEELWNDVGKDSGWLGGSGENWERGPYYCDGLVPLAYILDDSELIIKAKKWIDWSLKSQKSDGFFGPPSNQDWWARMVMLKVFQSYYEATKDPVVIPFMLKYFKYQANNLDKHDFRVWERTRTTENLVVMVWLYNLTGEDFLIDLIKGFIKKSKDWSEYFIEFPYRESTEKYMNWEEVYQITKGNGLEALYNFKDKEKAEKILKVFEETHIVNVVMGLKYPGLRYLITGDSKQQDIVNQGILNMMNYHGTITGMITGDEHLSGRNPSQGTELCAVVEYMYTLENLVRIFGDVKYGDLLEKVAYNALPATLSPDMMTHQYDQQINQVICNVAKRNWYNNLDDSNIFGLEPNFGCCTANMHQGWPKLVKHMWMATPDNGFAAIVYGPCVLTTELNGQKVKIVEETQYPFKGKVRINIELETPEKFPVELRIPEWARNTTCIINNDERVIEGVSGTFLKIDRVWNNGDCIEINFPMKIRHSSWYNNSIGIERGPLVYALKIDQNWNLLNNNNKCSEYEILPKEPWNYAIDLNSLKSEAIEIIENNIEKQPFYFKNAPIEINMKAKRIPEWQIKNNSAGDLPNSPVKADTDFEEITLIPYGCAHLRIAQFPYLDENQ